MKLSHNDMSSYLMYRILHPEKARTIEDHFPNRVPITDSRELEAYLKKRVAETARQGKVALALSGGIDSAILAKFLPKGSLAYTFRCVVPGVQVTDESQAAAQYAEACGLEHRIVEIYWEDFEKYADRLMIQKGAPIHSIEVQIYKACLRAREDGVDTLVFGEAADAVYGGQSMILSKDWRMPDFIERFAYVMPHRALKNPELPIEAMKRWEKDGYIDPFLFMSHVYIQESVGSYLNAAQTAGMDALLPYAETYLATPIDYRRIRAGENKYLVREVFQRLYEGFAVPPKLPMPRPMNEWMKDWKGPSRGEFWPHCADNMTGDQKWLVWALERYLDIVDSPEKA